MAQRMPRWANALLGLDLTVREDIIEAHATTVDMIADPVQRSATDGDADDGDQYRLCLRRGRGNILNEFALRVHSMLRVTQRMLLLPFRELM